MNKKGIETGYRGRQATQFKKGDERTRNAARAAAKKRHENIEERKKMRAWAEEIGGLAYPTIAPDGTKMETDMLGAAVMAQFKGAIMDGNTKAFLALATLLGETVEKHEVEAHGLTPIVVSNTETAEKLNDILNRNNDE